MNGLLSEGVQPLSVHRVEDFLKLEELHGKLLAKMTNNSLCMLYKHEN